MKTGQDYINNPTSGAISGFNCRIYGESYLRTFAHPHERQDKDRVFGWNLAEKMIAEGDIFFVHNFHNSHTDCSGHAFPYGGGWVCNTCCNGGLKKDWWVIKVFKDGDAWCCVGEGFVNLQESDNYAFGDTREESIKNYGDLFSPNQTGEK